MCPALDSIALLGEGGLVVVAYIEQSPSMGAYR
jgi:hypothetical protein